MSTMDQETARELRALRHEIRTLRHESRSAMHLGRHIWLRHVIKDFETNPVTQYKVHLWGSLYWLVNLPLVVLLFFFEPGLWLKLGIFITLVYSIYANFATDYGGMSAALAVGSNPLPQIPAEPPEVSP